MPVRSGVQCGVGCGSVTLRRPRGDSSAVLTGAPRDAPSTELSSVQCNCILLGDLFMGTVIR